jgi:hypothetical protein
MFYKKTPMVKVLVQILYQMIINAFGRQIKPRTQIQIGLASTFALILAILVPILAIHNNSFSERKTHELGTGKIHPDFIPENFSGVLIMANVTSVDTKNFETKVRFLMFPYGKYDSNRTDIEKFKTTVNFVTNGKRSIVTEFDLNPSEDVTYAIIFGDPNRYPFDVYSAEFFVAMKDGEIPVPLVFGLVGNVMGWNVKPWVADLPDNRIGVYMEMSRGFITKFFSMVPYMLM